MRGANRWMRRLTDQMAELHFLDLRGRLAASLVRMAREQGAGGGPIVLAPMTQGELAGLVAGTRQRVNAGLVELVRDGIISVE